MKEHLHCFSHPPQECLLNVTELRVVHTGGGGCQESGGLGGVKEIYITQPETSAVAC